MTLISYSTIAIAGLFFGSPANAFFQSPLLRSSPLSSRSISTATAQLLVTRRNVGDCKTDSSNDSDDPLHQRVHLFESILRDGEQGARKTLTPEQKGRFARKLEAELGVGTVLDAGLPGASPLDFAGVQSVVQHTHQAILSTLAHGTPTEIAVAARALRGAEERSRISTFHRPLELSTRYQNNDSSIRKRLLKQARRAIATASDLAPEVQYYLVYAGNRDPDFLAELAHVASDAGATHVVIADSQSALTPSKTHRLTAGINEALGGDNGKTTIAIHCHNQLGLALPNTLAAIRAGATQVESCLVGVGDAGGNLATEQFLAYCEHSQNSFRTNADNPDDELFPSSCSVLGGESSLPASVSLANEVAQMMKFSIGENQPILGERAFTCTTGIHQDNLDHLGHTTFQPQLAGREWKIALNRHSSRKSVQSFLSNHPELLANGSAESRADLVDAIYSYLSYRVDVMEEEAIVSFCHQLLEAHAVLRNRGVVICPTTVGYTLITTRNTKKMKSLKGRPDGKPCGILGTTEIYKAAFGRDPPLQSDRFVKHTVGYLGKPRGLTPKEFLQLPRDAIGSKGNVGIWVELGPVIDYLATRLWSESGDVIVATSCNVAGEGNPQSDHYDLSHIDSRVRSKVDFEVSIPHWESPELDDNGRWLSAPIWDLEKEVFLREGRDQDTVASLLLQEEATAEEEEEEQLVYEGLNLPEIEIPTRKVVGARNSTLLLV